MNHLKDVSDPAYIFDADVRVGAQILAKSCDEYIHTPGNEKTVVLPDTFEKDISFNQSAGVAEEHLKQLHFLVGKLRDGAMGIEGKVVNVKG